MSEPLDLEAIEERARLGQLRSTVWMPVTDFRALIAEVRRLRAAEPDWIERRILHGQEPSI